MGRSVLILLLSALTAFGWPVPDGQTPPPAARTPETSPGDAVVPWVLHRLVLEDVAPQIRGGLMPDTAVRFSPDSRLLAVGTMLGHVYLVDVYGGTTVWHRRLSEGMAKRLAFSPDGATLYVGEQSPDAFVYALDTATGKQRWRFRLADDLQSSPPPAKDDIYGLFTLPGCYQLIVLDDGDLLIAGLHGWGDFTRYESMQRLSRLWRLSPEGTLRWAFPAAAPAPMSFVHAAADPGGRRVAILGGVLGANANGDAPAPPGSLIVVDGVSGKPVGVHAFAPLKPYYDQVGFWQSVSVGPNGRRAAVGLHDGRTFLFDLDTVEPSRTYAFGTPIEISGVPVAARSTYTLLAPDGMAYFQTANSSVPNADSMEHMVEPPGPHPHANTINAIGPDGEVAWRFRSGHTYQNFWSDREGRWLLTSVERQDERGMEAGAMLFDTRRPGGGTAKLVWHYRLEGRIFFQADLAPDGSAAAIVEIPWQATNASKIIGTYQVHIIR